MPELPDGAWNAHWIALSLDPRDDLGVFAFRRRLDLVSLPASLNVRVSADQRYKLYVNGEFVGFGPQRGDELHWFYETYDLAPFLQEGENWILALVWNFGRWAPMAQHTVRTAFVLEAEAARESERGQAGITPEAPLPSQSTQRAPLDISTPDGWEVRRIEGWSFDMMHAGVGEFYIDVGPGEIICAGKETSSLICVSPLEPGKDLEWHPAQVICNAQDRGTNGGGTPWMLIPRSIPPMIYEPRSDPPRIRRGFAGDVDGGPEDGTPLWPVETNALVKKVQLTPDRPLVLDYGELHTAYPRLFLSTQGKAQVTLTYDEALWNPDGSKGNRNEVAGKSSRGYQDKFILEGYSEVFEPLWWRTYRYLRIETNGPVELLDIEAIETGYPLAEESSFEADDEWVKPIWDVSVRTVRRCAGETYFDCPYYEQLQYVGDTRIQALIGYYLGRDRALQRNAVETLGWSLMENGLTQSRYPSRQAQIIPPFSLWWVMMLYDQMLYDEKNWFVDKESNDFWDVVAWHWRRHWRKEPSTFWPFFDWVPEWSWGVPPGALDHPAAILLEELASRAKDALSLRRPMSKLTERMLEFPKTRLSRDLVVRASSGNWPGAKAEPTEHAEALKRVLQFEAGANSDPWPTEALAKAKAAKCTYYFSYYKHLAMFSRPDVDRVQRSANPKSAIRNPQSFDYLQELAPWKEMIENGLTTFAENPEPTRSDCHAWSAHPILGFFQIVAGVTSIAPGWKKARIDPRPGSLKRFKATIAHPEGELVVAFEDGRLEIDSPVKFELRWKGKREELKAGRHNI